MDVELISNANDDLARLADDALLSVFPERSIEKVLLVIPPDADERLFNLDTAKRGRYYNYPGYGAGVIAAHLRAIGIEVSIFNLNNLVLRAAQETEEGSFDFRAAWRTPLSDCIRDFAPDLVGVSCMFTQTHNSTVAVLNELRTIFPTLPITLGGVHVTNCLSSQNTSKTMLSDFGAANFLFTHEAESAFVRFVEVVNQERPCSELIQVHFNTFDDKLSFTNRGAAMEGEELDRLPALDLMNLDELSSHGTIGSFYCLVDPGTRFATVLSNRGCRARCTFCSVRSFNGKGVRTRSVQSVIDELLRLRHDYGVGHVMWLDDDFLYGRKRSIELFNEMVRQDVGITWDCTNGVIAASCTEDVISAAAASGCLGLNLGMESGNPKILREVHKPGTVENFLAAAEVLRKYPQINARVFLMLGFPGETYRMILDTIQVSQQMNLDWYNVTILQPLPGTPIFMSMVEQGLLDSVGFEEIRYNSGAYGKHRKSAELNRDMLARDFKDAFSQVDLDRIPSGEELDDIWAYMNFHLNFRRLFDENRPIKMKQQLAYLRNIADLVSPDNAFAQYFSGVLEHRILGATGPAVISRLEKYLNESPYWQQRFDEFGLRTDQLVSGDFPA